MDSIDEIEFKNVSFSYDNKKYILSGFNYKFEKGKIYCIAGRNGIGKSTLIDLMAGLYNDYSGQILFNSTDIRELDMYRIRKDLIGLTEQEPVLLSDTVINNLTFGINENYHNSLKNVCKEIMIDDFINNLPDGLNSIIGEKASNISGGEKQKLSIARILMKDSDVLIFDEPTSALDIASINKFKLLVEGIKSNKIIIIITHSENILAIADEIIQFTNPDMGNSVLEDCKSSCV